MKRTDAGEIIQSLFLPVLTVIVLIVAVIAVIGTVYVVRADNRWDKACRAEGNHVISNTAYGTGIGSNGRVVTTSTTTTYCLTPSGGIAGMR